MNTNDRLAELRKKEEEELAQILAQRHKISYLDLTKMTIDLDSLKIIPEADARANSMAVIQSVGKKLQVALTNPDRPGVADTLDNLKRRKYETQLFLVSPAGLDKAFSKYKEIPRFEETKVGIIDISKSKLESYEATLHSLANFKKALAAAREKDVRKASDTLELLYAGALDADASDVHIEAEIASAKIRLRIDGVLQDIIDVPLPLYQLLLSRIKLLSEVKLNVRDKPQDGRFTIKTAKEDVEVRTSFLPGPFGESIVMRLLLPKTIAIRYEELGMQPALFEMMKGELLRPNGMILVTGPTGSGKTTTLYAFLKSISSSEVKVITIEDPIEYHIAHITQTQIDPSKGYDFVNGLRSILRQDPDIILVGEIRDLETAQIAMHAALTGHLVFSTLHTNDAAGTVPRLIDLGVKVNVISPALNIAMAQRLTRQLCTVCKKADKPTDEEKALIEKYISLMPEVYKKDLPKDIAMFRPVGCEKCGDTGYKGRIGVFEAFLVDDEMERLIITSPPAADVQALAIKKGMLTMYQDGVIKIMRGVTTFEELDRVAAA
ncbi:MAG: ATPase, T2SS/T4P/T4SS family [bacterium]|nr:ATPase, T2SS/T4P/T4SS family [bacterium]